MSYVESLLQNNKSSARDTISNLSSDFSYRQSPKVFWIGCCDSRVHPLIHGQAELGEIFLYSNVANQVVANDLSFDSILEFAVNHLKIKEIVICGHTNCGGVIAACSKKKLGILDVWLSKISEAADRFKDELRLLPDDSKYKRLAEINVLIQKSNLQAHPIMISALKKNLDIKIYPLILDLSTGLFNQLD